MNVCVFVCVCVCVCVFEDLMILLKLNSMVPFKYSTCLTKDLISALELLIEVTTDCSGDSKPSVYLLGEESGRSHIFWRMDCCSRIFWRIT